VPIADPLFAVLDDPDRAAEHAAAIRALAVLASASPRAHLKEDAARIKDRLEEIILEGDASLLAPSIAAYHRVSHGASDYRTIIDSLSGEAAPERAKQIRDVDQQQFFDELNAI
jgi:hypothetical protein